MLIACALREVPVSVRLSVNCCCLCCCTSCDSQTCESRHSIAVPHLYHLLSLVCFWFVPFSGVCMHYTEPPSHTALLLTSLQFWDNHTCFRKFLASCKRFISQQLIALRVGSFGLSVCLSVCLCCLSDAVCQAVCLCCLSDSVCLAVCLCCLSDSLSLSL